MVKAQVVPFVLSAVEVRQWAVIVLVSLSRCVPGFAGGVSLLGASGIILSSSTICLCRVVLSSLLVAMLTTYSLPSVFTQLELLVVLVASQTGSDVGVVSRSSSVLMVSSSWLSVDLSVGAPPAGLVVSFLSMISSCLSVKAAGVARRILLSAVVVVFAVYCFVSVRLSEL